MSTALAALWSAVVKAARAGTLRQSISDGVALATWALAHPAEFGAMVDMIRGMTGGELGSAAVESPAMDHAAGDKPGGR